MELRTTRGWPNDKAFKSDLVTVAAFGNSMEAQLACTKLKSLKIHSYVFDENLISIMPLFDLALGGVRLSVKNTDLYQASKVLGLKSGGNFWVPSKLFFLTYLFSEYLFSLLMLPIGVFLYLIKDLIFGSFDGNLFLGFNAVFLGAFCLVYSKRIMDSYASLAREWKGTKINEDDVLRTLRFVGAFTVIFGISRFLFRGGWFSYPILFWCLLSLGVWKVFFDLVSGPRLTAYAMKRVKARKKLTQ